MGRNAGHSLPGPDISRDHSASSNYRILTDGNAFEDNRVRADPNVIADLDLSFKERLVRDRPLFAKSMIVIGYVTEGPNHASGPNVYTVRCIEHRKAIDVRTGANVQSRSGLPRSCSKEHHLIIQSNGVVNDDIPRVSRHMNAPNPTSPTNTNPHPSQTGNANTTANRTGVSN
jgi:hypothetical protein